MTQADVEAYKEDGKFISSAWPGGYPMYYLDEENNVLCPACANKEDMSTEVVAGDVNWEDTELTCDDCGKPIESAYGEKENEREEI